MQITSYRPASIGTHRFPDKHSPRPARVTDNFLLLVLWIVLSLTCCAAAMAVADVL
ncbi:hypothetical protein [Cupriavidus oxalaticus]|uniref:hypothetical protein n=1 Tax=Cupriavidus oxalaticus TaxID=96344 RepID=UPI00142EE914|nr:hypothetical protein [Cupriavidus oxalaticus]